MPIYQVEDYIANSIESICNQNFEGYEVILVNDGTKDRSVDIAKEILEKSNISYRIINQSNKGVSAARNEGIRNSKGEWIVCVDPDDILDPDFLITLYKSCIYNKTDISISGFQVINNDRLQMKARRSYSTVVIEQKNILYKFLIRKIKIISPAILIKKEFIIKNNLWYDPEIKFSEDQHFIWRILLSSNKVAYNRTPNYNYLIRDNSTMTSSNLEKIITGYNGFIKFVKNIDSSNYDELIKYILPRWVLGVMRAATKMMDYSCFNELANKMEYKKYIIQLIKIPDYKTKILSLILLFDLKIFYILNRKI